MLLRGLVMRVFDAVYIVAVVVAVYYLLVGLGL